MICRDLYFIYENNVDVYFDSNIRSFEDEREVEDKGFVLKEGSYFGEISMLFEIKNTYSYIC